jgi:toxin FitB
MRLLLDTCVVSEVRHPNGSDAVKRYVAGRDDGDMFVSVITLGELVRGISLLDDGQRKRELAAWLDVTERDFGERIVGIDAETGRLWGEVTARMRRQGRHLAAADGLIAASALRHGLHVATRNVSDFEGTGAFLVNPWGTAG